MATEKEWSEFKRRTEESFIRINFLFEELERLDEEVAITHKEMMDEVRFIQQYRFANSQVS